MIGNRNLNRRDRSLPTDGCLRIFLGFRDVSSMLNLHKKGGRQDVNSLYDIPLNRVSFPLIPCSLKTWERKMYELKRRS